MWPWRRRAAGEQRAAASAREPFPPEFVQLLMQIVQRAPRQRDVVDRAGAARKRVLSRSGTFVGHRRYGDGDDVRDVDWSAYARTGELFAKALEDEERRTLTLLLDLSPSVDAGEPPRRTALLRFAAIEGALALARLDALHLVFGNGQVNTLRSAAALPTLFSTLRAAPAAHEPMAMVRQPLDEGFAGRLVWLSDFAPPDAVAPALRLLRRHGRRCIGMIPELPDDRVPLARGLVALRDPETGAREVMRVDDALRDAVAEELQHLHRAQDAMFRVCGYPLWRVPVPPAGDFSLAAWRQPWLEPRGFVSRGAGA